MIHSDDLLLFAHVVDCGGFTAAARRLDRPKSTLSKRVAALEAQLGAQLVHRSSRRFALTDAGREVYAHARAARTAVDAAADAVHRRQAEPSGVVRITTSVPTAQWYLAARLPALALAHPKLSIQLHVTDRFVDLLHEGFDIAVRSHTEALPDSGLVQRAIRRQPIVLVASPSYLRRHPAPLRPRDLQSHQGLLVSAAKGGWRLIGPTGRVANATPTARLIADETVVLREAALAGLGIAPLPQRFVAAEVGAGKLVRLLPDWHAGHITTTLLTPHQRGQLPAIRTVMDFLARPEAD